MILNEKKTINGELREWLLKVFAFTDSLSRTPLARRNCPVCGSVRSEFFVNNGYLDFAKCTDCSLIFMNPASAPSLVDGGFKGDDQLVMEYFRIKSRHRKVVSERPDPERDGQLCDIYQWKKSGRLLDIGCSFGDFLRKASHFYSVEGVEVNPLTARIASQDFTVHQHYLHEVKLPQVYDIVTLHQILYGVPDPVGLFLEVSKILKHDGILYVNTPNADSHALRLYQGKANHVYGYMTQNVFNRKSLKALADRTGFRVRSFRTEWLDVYLTDLLVFLETPAEFIHKKNTHLTGYEDRIKQEDEFHRSLGLELGDRGNYLVAILEKT